MGSAERAGAGTGSAPPRRTAVLFGAVLRRERVAAGLTQEALAEAAEVHPTHVSRLERGQRAPSLETVLRLAAALGQDPAAWVAEVWDGWEPEP